MDVKNSDSKILFVDAVRRLSTSERVWFAWTTIGWLCAVFMDFSWRAWGLPELYDLRLFDYLSHIR